MARDPGLRQSLPPVALAILLLACTVSGLAAGAGTRRLVDSARFGAVSGTQGTHATGSIGPATTPAASASPGGGLPTATLSPQLTGFSLSEQVSPTAVKVGQQFSVVATVTAYNSGTPLGGIRCTLGPPAIVKGSGPSLFTRWPQPVLSDSQGKATWVLQAPNVSAGPYQLVVLATGTHGYYVYAEYPVTIV